ncbi:MAG: DMT family transporter, partial [Acidobacteriota bacterium]|nr:DMT family transporter [Acidobacteriota bacterium]
PLPLDPRAKLPIVLVFVLVSASNPVAIKFALESGWSALPLGIARMGFIGLFFLLWVLAAREHPLGASPQGRRYSLMAACCKGVGVLTFYLALSLVPASRVIVLSTFSPVVALLMIHWLLEHERVRGRQWLGVAISFAGLALLLFFRGKLSLQGGQPGHATLLGDVCMILSVIFHTAMVIFEKKAILVGIRPRQLIVSTNLVSLLVFTAMAFAVDDSGFATVPMSAPALWAYGYLISVAGVFLFYYRRWMVGVLELGYITSFSHLGKAVGLLFAAMLLRETIPLSNLGAFTLILVGSMVSNRTGVAPAPGTDAAQLLSRRPRT